MGIFSRSATSRKPNETIKIILTTFLGVAFGFLIGVSFPTLSLTKLNIPSNFIPSIDSSYKEGKSLGLTPQSTLSSKGNNSSSTQAPNLNGTSKIWVPSNPRGAERLPPRIVAAESDFYLRRLWGNPNELCLLHNEQTALLILDDSAVVIQLMDLTSTPKYLVTFTVGYDQRMNIDACVKKFSENFTILLFHYDGRVAEWDEFEWSKRAIHVSVRKQTKWWYAKRFLHPDIVAPYEYIFIWDEDLGVEHFNAEEYIKLVKKHGLEISQPGLEPNKGLTWQMTKRRDDSEVHKFVEIMAPVFSRDAWRCVWHMIQNDLVHGWGLDFALRKCIEPAHEKIGVVDSQWIVHGSVPSLGSQGESQNGKAPWQGVRERCRKEWTMFQTRLTSAENAYFRAAGLDPSTSKGR
ncbi:hypothetical protein SADUNF_Sadunf08G0152400 [Salix dunnii]|uniref:Uncharacterized protein n=1 Tax=Salix dunnii TaxID=1413687 RepID=A0A835JUS7_9ROSI|nr:hypothetical protein SADUNF_Sadunf08G0152400 [Salix dunnii]